MNSFILSVATVSGESMAGALIELVCVGVVFWLLWWLLGYIGLPEPFNKVARVILALAAVLILINMLMGFAGHPFIRW